MLIPILLTAIGIAGAASWASFQIVRRRKMLDDVFLPLGLEGASYLINGRQYRGTFSGRPVYVYLSRGPQMEIYVESPLRTRLSVSSSDALIQWIAKRANEQAIPVDDPSFSHLVLYAADPGWANQLFAIPEARSGILRLADLSLSNSPQIMIQPGALVLRLPGIRMEHLSPGVAQQKLSSMIHLAQLAESLPAASKIIEASAWEKKSQTNRNAFLWPALGIVIAILLVAILVAAVCTYGITLIPN
jgi:hypothetical protein